MGMTRVLLVLALFGAPAAARAAAAKAPVRFVPGFLASMSVALRTEPFYASKVLAALDGQVREFPRPTPAAAVRLRDRITAGRSVARFNEELGQKPLDETRAAAILLANAMARPEQFREVADGLETLRAGLGAGVVRALGRIAQGTVPRSAHAVYTAKGGLDALFDGAPAPGLPR